MDWILVILFLVTNDLGTHAYEHVIPTHTEAECVRRFNDIREANGKEWITAAGCYYIGTGAHHD